ncbi:MAG: glycosyltransferase [Pseudomonadota bacterium]
MADITVGMPVYNGEEYLASAIESNLAQTYGDFELLISDNASSDGTEDICRTYAAQDSRIRYLRHAHNLGAAANYNVLVDEAKTPFFRWSNADDLLVPTLHERCRDALLAHTNAALAAGTTIFIDAGGAETGTYDDNLHLPEDAPSERFAHFFQQVGLTNVIYGLMRTEKLRLTDRMGNGTVPAADTVLMGQLTLHGQFIMLDEPLFYRRMHEQSSSADRADVERQQSFWSAGKSKFRRPTWSTFKAYRHAVTRANLPTDEKQRVHRILHRRLWRSKRALLREFLN